MLAEAADGRAKTKLTDGQSDLDDDEEELQPEARAQDAVLAEVYAEALVLCADEDGAHDVADDEEDEEVVVQGGVPVGVEDGQQDEAEGAGDAGDDGDDAEALLRPAGVAGELAAVAQPALGDERGVEQDDGDGAAGDEERFQGVGAGVGDVAEMSRECKLDACTCCSAAVLLLVAVQDEMSVGRE